VNAIRFEDGLPFITAVIHANGQRLLLLRVLVDTGSVATRMDTDDLRALGVVISPNDPIRFVSGVGGNEPYVETYIDGIELDGKLFGGVSVQAGVTSHGVQIDAILGVDFLKRARIILDFEAMEFRFG